MSAPTTRLRWTASLTNTQTQLFVAVAAGGVVLIGAVAWIVAERRADEIASCVDEVACEGDAGDIVTMRAVSLAGLLLMFAGVFVEGFVARAALETKRAPRRRLVRARLASPDPAPASWGRAAPPKAPPSGRHCARCSAALMVGDTTCANCGAAVPTACVVCGADIRNARGSCPGCATPLGVS